MGTFIVYRHFKVINVFQQFKLDIFREHLLVGVCPRKAVKGVLFSFMFVGDGAGDFGHVTRDTVRSVEFVFVIGRADVEFGLVLFVGVATDTDIAVIEVPVLG